MLLNLRVGSMMRNGMSSPPASGLSSSLASSWFWSIFGSTRLPKRGREHHPETESERICQRLPPSLLPTRSRTAWGMMRIMTSWMANRSSNWRRKWNEAMVQRMRKVRPTGWTLRTHPPLIIICTIHAQLKKNRPRGNPDWVKSNQGKMMSESASRAPKAAAGKAVRTERNASLSSWQWSLEHLWSAGFPFSLHTCWRHCVCPAVSLKNCSSFSSGSAIATVHWTPSFTPSSTTTSGGHSKRFCAGGTLGDMYDGLDLVHIFFFAILYINCKRHWSLCMDHQFALGVTAWKSFARMSFLCTSGKSLPLELSGRKSCFLLCFSRFEQHKYLIRFQKDCCLG